MLNKKMKMQLIKNQYCINLIEKYCDIEYIISHPLSSEIDKQNLPQWAGYIVTRPVRDRDSYAYQTVLIVEYDGTMEIETFISRYSHYTYHLHTTSSHTKETPKIRALIPLSRPVEMSYMRDQDIREALFALFEICDKSCLSNFHKLPQQSKKKDDYYYKTNISNTFDIFTDNKFQNILKKIKIEKRLKKQHTEMIKNDKKTFESCDKKAYKKVVDSAFAEILADIPRHTSGDRYNRLLSATYKISRAEYPDGEMIYDECDCAEIILAHTDDRAVRKMITDTYRRV